MPNFPGSLPSATPATHGEVVDELRALALRGAIFPQPVYTSTWWYPHPQAFNQANHGPGTNALILSPMWLPFGTTISAIGEWVQTAGSAGAVRRLGIYADNGAFYPGALLVDAGTIDGTTTGFKSLTLGSNLDIGGLTWVGGVNQTAVTGVSGITNNMPGISGGSGTPPTGTNNLNSYLQSGVSGALPSTFTSTVTTNNNAPKTYFKIA